MKTIFASLITVTLLGAAPCIAADRSDPQAYMKENFWENLYKEGGATFYCEKPFTKKSILIDEAYIYSDSWIRDHLMCGTPRQCRQGSELYQQMITDMHNVYPSQSRFELKRKNAKFEELGAGIPEESCGEKRSFLIIDPPQRIKGDIARALAYMHKKYNLPFVGVVEQFKRWNKLDPVSPEEADRNRRIKELQGNDNPYISDPNLMDSL